ncbi:MAG: ribonuclease PH [Victivallaceae bacterium]|nr:ribonuclease PH [Victivallaceae bacterium]
MARIDGRANDELRPISIKLDYLRHPAGSACVCCGNTKVIAAATFENKVPPWMKSQNKTGGWITCEYGMLPASTGERMKREASQGKQGGRTVEIQRLIGRSLRMCSDLRALGERTVHIDCDVIDADGGTRCASITAGALAICRGYRRLAPEFAEGTPFRELVAAVSVGIVGGETMLDLCYEEDSRAEVDMNVVMTESGKIIEIQGTAEGAPFDRKRLNELVDLAESGLRDIFAAQRKALEEI